MKNKILISIIIMCSSQKLLLSIFKCFYLMKSKKKKLKASYFTYIYVIAFNLSLYSCLSLSQFLYGMWATIAQLPMAANTAEFLLPRCIKFIKVGVCCLLENPPKKLPTTQACNLPTNQEEFHILFPFLPLNVFMHLMSHFQMGL